MKTKIARGLLRQRTPRQRRRQIVIYAASLVVLFVVHGYVSNLETALKLIPQTIIAIAMGYVILLIVSLRQFDHVADFIDWDKVTENAEPVAPRNSRPADARP